MINARRKAVVGFVGLAVLGGGAYVVTDRLADDKPAVTGETGALAPVTPATSSTSTSAEASPSVTPATSSAVPTKSPSPSPSAAKSTSDRVKAAREAAAKHGVKVQRPLPNNAVDPTITAADLTVTQSVNGRQSMRVVSARKNLAGYRELGWVADGGEPAGDARCSQTFRFSATMKPAEKPALLVCWRTSATRSVYTVTTDPGEHPSKQASVAAIDKQWNRLG